MTQPLALVLYESLLPGSQLANRLRDLGYRVSTVSVPQQLVTQAETEKPMIVVVELQHSNADICAILSELKQNPATGHVPVIGFVGAKQKELQAAAVKAGVNLVASDAGLLAQLPQLLEQALEVE